MGIKNNGKMVCLQVLGGYKSFGSSVFLVASSRWELYNCDNCWQLWSCWSTVSSSLTFELTFNSQHLYRCLHFEVLIWVIKNQSRISALQCYEDCAIFSLFHNELNAHMALKFRVKIFLKYSIIFWDETWKSTWFWFSWMKKESCAIFATFQFTYPT